MTNDLCQTWNDIAAHWNDWGPPLRPCAEDLRIECQALAHWHRANPTEKVEAFLFGVTPEIAAMSWPFPVDLLAMDQSARMLQVVWPGDIPGVRRAVVGNWLDPGLAPRSRDIVIGDGGLGFYDYPGGQRRVLLALRNLLRPGGLFVYRLFAQQERRETLDEVLRACHARRIGNFHVFKWRLAMAMQPDSRVGVRQDDIWRACMAAGLELAELPQPGWSPQAISTIRFYQGKETRLYFPTLAEFHGLLAETFDHVEVRFPTYELGERCPILMARPRGD